MPKGLGSLVHTKYSVRHELYYCRPKCWWKSFNRYITI